MCITYGPVRAVQRAQCEGWVEMVEDSTFLTLIDHRILKVIYVIGSV